MFETSGFENVNLIHTDALKYNKCLIKSYSVSDQISAKSVGNSSKILSNLCPVLLAMISVCDACKCIIKYSVSVQLRQRPLVLLQFNSALIDNTRFTH